jgi:hypothetical protein
MTRYAIFVFSCLLWMSADDMSAQETHRKHPQIQVQLKILELPRDPRGVERVLSEPAIVTHLGRSATFVAGGEAKIPDQAGFGREHLSFGTIAEFTPRAMRGEKLRADVSIQATQLKTTDDEDLVAAAGPTCKMSGLFELGKTYRLPAMALADRTIVFEATVEAIEQR